MKVDVNLEASKENGMAKRKVLRLSERKKSITNIEFSDKIECYRA